MARAKQKQEFIKLYLTGEYTNRQLAKIFKISEQSVCNWVAASQLVKLHKAKENLANELYKLSQLNYDVNEILINRLLNDIERIAKLIAYTKY